jgi:hypothetical protein
VLFFLFGRKLKNKKSFIMSLSKFHELPTRLQCLVAVAVLLDGVDASIFLINDSQHGKALSMAAEDLSDMDPELRMPYVGTLLRESLRFLEGAGGKTIT